MPTEKRQRKRQGRELRREQALAELRRKQRRRRLRTFPIVAIVVLLVIGLLSRVGGSGKDDTALQLKVAGGKTVSVDVPKKAPTKLVTRDLRKGTGATAALGKQITVDYVGVKYDGTQFDSSFESGKPATFGLAKGSLIDGWVQGIPGMKVGGRRVLIIPGKLAYGTTDKGDGRPYGPLVFVVDLKKVG